MGFRLLVLVPQPIPEKFHEIRSAAFGICKPCAGYFLQTIAGLLQTFSSIHGDRMSSVARQHHFDRETRNAFNELLVMEQLSKLPVGAVLRVLQTIPLPVLEVALQKTAND